MGRKPCCEKVGLKRGPWTAEEDGKLVAYITKNGICCWRAIPKLAGLLRCGKSCRLRWTNYLRPDLKRGIFSAEEENLILGLHVTLGNRWSRIAAQLPGRTDNEIKNYWNTRLKKRLRRQGLDPATHLPLESGSKQTDGEEDGDGSDSSDDVASGTTTRPAKAPKIVEKPKVRQPKGPKPQLQMCQSKEGQLVLLTAPFDSPKPCKSEADSDSTSGSTVTADGANQPPQQEIARKLATAPSFPQAEIWKCIKPMASNNPFNAASELCHEWDSCITQLSNSHIAPAASGGDFVGENEFGAVPQGDCKFPEVGMLDPWTMHSELNQPAPESMFAPCLPPPLPLNLSAIFPDVPLPHHQQPQQPVAPIHQSSQELQRLATLLDLI